MCRFHTQPARAHSTPTTRLPSRPLAPPRPGHSSATAPAACQPTSLPSRLSSTAWRRSSASLSKPYGASSRTPRTLSACSELLRRRFRAHWSPSCRRRCAERLDLRRDASHHRAGRCCKPRPHTRGGNVEARGVGLGGGRHVADGCAPIAHDHPARRQARAMLADARGVMDLPAVLPAPVSAGRSLTCGTTPASTPWSWKVPLGAVEGA